MKSVVNLLRSNLQPIPFTVQLAWSHHRFYISHFYRGHEFIWSDQLPSLIYERGSVVSVLPKDMLLVGGIMLGPLQKFVW